MSGTPFYSEPIDMDGNTRLRVEARLLPDPSLPPAYATVRVQGTDDELTAARKCWADEGLPLDLAPGTEYWTIFHNTHGVVRVGIVLLTPGDQSRIEVRLTRLP